MVCSCSKCNYFTTEDLRNSLKLLEVTFKNGTFDLYDLFVSFVTILKKTPMTEQTLKLGNDPDFEEDPHLQAYDALGEILNFLRQLRSGIHSVYCTNWQSLARVDFIHFLYFIETYTKNMWQEFFSQCPTVDIKGMPWHTMTLISSEISFMVNLVSKKLPTFQSTKM